MANKKLPSRGAASNPVNRYEKLAVAWEDEYAEGERLRPTEYFRDASRSVLAENSSPDVPFRFSLNPYRGCEHGCVYCYARPTHEYLGFSAGLDFEQRIMVKEDAPALLRATFSSPRWQPEVVALSGNTDCYQPIERHLRITRRCLEVFAEFRNPVGVVTKSTLVLRDLDLLQDLARDNLVRVAISITTLDGNLARRLEPRAAQPQKRLEAVAALASAGVQVAVMAAPVIPGLNDEEIPRILAAAREVGAMGASYVLLRLPRPVDRLFADWLREHFPERVRRVLGRVRECRQGKLYSSEFDQRKTGTGPYADHVAELFRVTARRLGLDRPLPPLNTGAFRRPQRDRQLSLL
ncbi:MAG: PA0069 family radical SAM protein [Candidatus Binatia bacterium]|nr:PA0069 family radical SAM protein [Candidatus Binatia bacterium]